MRNLPGNPRMGYVGGINGYMLIPMILMCLMVLVIFAYVVYMIVKQIKAHKLGHIHGQTQQISSASVDTTKKAIEILNERFAKGEILEEEYKSKKELILK